MLHFKDFANKAVTVFPPHIERTQEEVRGEIAGTKIYFNSGESEWVRNSYADVNNAIYAYLQNNGIQP